MRRMERGRDINPQTILKLRAEFSSYLLHAAGEKSKRSLLTPVSHECNEEHFLVLQLKVLVENNHKFFQNTLNYHEYSR